MWSKATGMRLKRVPCLCRHQRGKVSVFCIGNSGRQASVRSIRINGHKGITVNTPIVSTRSQS